MAAIQPNHYDILGIARDSDAGEIRAAWKLHVQVWHPDRFTGEMRDEAEKRAARINEAYTALRDSSRRAAYDCRLAADGRDAERMQSAPRSSVKMRPAAPRAASTPVGTPMAVAEPANLAEQLNAVAIEAMRSARRHPRTVAAAAAVWVALLGGGAMLHAINGPSLPTNAATASASTTHTARIAPSDEDLVDLEEVARQSQREAARAEAEMERLMAQDEAAARAADAEASAAADAAAARAAADAARTTPKAGARTSDAAAPTPGGRIVRVMPAEPVQ